MVFLCHDELIDVFLTFDFRKKKQILGPIQFPLEFIQP